MSGILNWDRTALSIRYISFCAVWELDNSLEDKSAGMSTFSLDEEKLNVWWVMNPGSAFLDLKHRTVPCEVTNAALHLTMSSRAISAFHFPFWGIILHLKALQLQPVA